MLSFRNGAFFKRETIHTVVWISCILLSFLTWICLNWAFIHIVCFIIDTRETRARLRHVEDLNFVKISRPRIIKKKNKNDNRECISSQCKALDHGLLGLCLNHALMGPHSAACALSYSALSNLKPENWPSDPLTSVCLSVWPADMTTDNLLMYQ